MSVASRLFPLPVVPEGSWPRRVYKSGKRYFIVLSALAITAVQAITQVTIARNIRNGVPRGLTSQKRIATIAVKSKEAPATTDITYKPCFRVSRNIDAHEFTVPPLVDKVGRRDNA
jgi:hypothetical protein